MLFSGLGYFYLSTILSIISYSLKLGNKKEGAESSLLLPVFCSLTPGLFSQSKSLDQGTIPLDIYFLKVCKKSSSLTYHLKKSSS